MIPVVIGLDPSLTDTGVAVMTPGHRPVFRGVTVAHIPGSSGIEYEAERMRLMAARVYTFATSVLPVDYDMDVWVAVEEPAFASKDGKADERAGVRWLMLQTLAPHAAHLVTINTRVVKKYWTGNGGTKTDKKVMMQFTRRRYPELGMTDHNANDALVIAQIVARHRGFGLEPVAPQVDEAALTGVSWPST